MAMPLWLKEKLFQKTLLRDEMKKLAAGLRLAEAPAVRRASPEPRRLGVLPVALRGGRGPAAWTASANGRPRRSACGQGNKLEMLKEIHFPHSLGLLYSAFTYYTGFKVNSGEYKVMGLAPYGEPKFKDTILEQHRSTSRRTAPSGSTRATSTIAPACA